MAYRYSKNEICIIQANLYIINKIFTHTKRDKVFDDTTFFSIMLISKPRYYRILKGISFNISENECTIMARKIGVSEECFKGKKLIDLEGIKYEHWYAFFKARREITKELNYEQHYNLIAINKKLDAIKYRNILLEYPMSSEVYKIQFYFTYGNKYEEMESSLRIKKSITELEAIKYNEWTKLDTSLLDEYCNRLKIQHEKLKALAVHKKNSNE